MITENVQYKQLVRMRGLAQDYRNELPAAGVEGLANLTSELSNLATLVGSEACTLGKERESSRIKAKARTELRAEVAAIHRIAAAIGLETPGFAHQFRPPQRGDEQLLATARSFAENAAPVSAVFLEHALPENFIEALNAKIQAFEETSNKFAEASRATKAVAVEIEAATQRAVAASKLLDAVVRNTLRNDSLKLAEWDRACQSGVKRPRQKQADSPPPVPTPTS